MVDVRTEIDPISLDEIPSMPAATVRFVGLCDNPDVEIAVLSQVISLDPALSAKILRMANSAAFGRGRPSTSVERSMMMMGIKAAKLTALGFVVSSALPDAEGASPETMSQVWHECLLEAVACRELATVAGLRFVPEAFLAGMFDGMRKLLAVLIRPEQYGNLIFQNPWPSDYAEREILGMSSGQLLTCALDSWGIPDLFQRTIREANGDSRTFDNSEVGRMAAVVVLARQATRLLSGQPPNDLRADIAGRSLDLDLGSVDRIAGTVGRHLNDLAKAMDIDLQGTPDYPAMLEKARSQILETSLDIAQESVHQNDQISALQMERESLHHEATTDRLTELPNRASFEDHFNTIISNRIEGRTQSGSFGLALIDIDHFKQVNDTYGHNAGDEVLKAVGKALRRSTRETEIIARYGGEEFAMLLPVVHGHEGITSAVERVRTVVESLKIETSGTLISVTVSVGGIALQNIAGDETGQRMKEAADRLLYEAKDAGRNCCRVAYIDNLEVRT